MRTALKIGFLAFEATRRATTDVYYPIDIVLYKNDSFQMVQHHYQREDLSEIGDWWQERIVQSIRRTSQPLAGPGPCRAWKSRTAGVKNEAGDTA